MGVCLDRHERPESRVLKRALTILLVALTLVAVAMGAADGKKRKKRSRSKRLNMPSGWVWPPSKQMKRDGEACLERLDALGVKYKRVKKKTRKVAMPITVPQMELGGVKLTSLHRKPPFIMDCHFAEAMAAHAGPALKAAGIKELRLSAIHDYRNVRLRKKTLKILSRHALGLAMDVYQFVDDKDVVHIVKDHYKFGDALLLTAEQIVNGTGAFRLLLT